MKLVKNSAIQRSSSPKDRERMRFTRRLSNPAVTGAESGIMLVECLVYITLWALITGLALAAFFRVLDNATRLRRNADDIVRALRAGEKWREDVRRAVGPLKIVTGESGADQAWHIPQASGEVVYFFTGAELLRRSKQESPWIEALGGIKRSMWIKDSGPHVTSWRWEVELQAGKKKPLTRPLFSFEAVPSFQEKP